MSKQNRISYGFAPPNSALKGYSPKNILDRNDVASSARPIAFKQVVQITVPVGTFGTNFSNYFEIQSKESVCHGDLMNLRLFQLFARTAWEAKQFYDQGLAKEKKKEPKIIGYIGDLGNKNFFVNERSTIYETLNSLQNHNVEGWAAAQGYKLVDEVEYAETWEGYELQEEGNGGVYVFVEIIPKKYGDEELKHAGAYRMWIVLEKGCTIDINELFQTIIKPNDDRKKKKDIQHYDQYRYINNNGIFGRHISNMWCRDDTQRKFQPDLSLDNEVNDLCPTKVFDAEAYFNHVVCHEEAPGVFINKVRDLFPGDHTPDKDGFSPKNYIHCGTFLVQEQQRGFMIELTTDDLHEERLMKKYKPDIWLFYILTRQVHSILEDLNKQNKEQDPVRTDDYIVGSVGEMFTHFKISSDATTYALNGHAVPTVWANSKNTRDDSNGKCWEEGTQDVMRLRTITFAQDVPKFNDEMASFTMTLPKAFEDFLKYL